MTLCCKVLKHLQMTISVWISWCSFCFGKKHVQKCRKCCLLVFSPFPTVLFKHYFTRVIKSQDYDLNLECALIKKKLLTPYCILKSILMTYRFNPFAKTNFRVFQTERVCRQQFQIWRKWQKVIQRVENTLGKAEIARYEQFLLFPQCFQKACTADM